MGVSFSCLTRGSRLLALTGVFWRLAGRDMALLCEREREREREGERHTQRQRDRQTDRQARGLCLLVHAAISSKP